MIDYARPHELNMCDVYPAPSPAPARLDDFQVFKKGTTPHIYTDYYNHYDFYEPDLACNPFSVYQTLASRESCRDAFKTKMVSDWTEEDTVSWILNNTFEMGLQDYEVPYFNFKLKGTDLYRMKRDDFSMRMLQPHTDPMRSRSIGDIMFDKLQTRIREENPVFRYADSSYNSTYNVLDLDSVDNKSRAYQSDYKPNDLNILPPLYESESPEPDGEEMLRLSPEYSCGSDGSKSGDEDDKRKLFKRPPGRPRGSGKKVSKRPRSVSVPEFLRNLLMDPKYCPAIIKWEDYAEAKFRFVKPDEVAKLWGRLKQNEDMNFEKFSRAMRYHYKAEVLKSVPTARLVYRFGRKGPDIRTDNPNFINLKTEVPYDSHNNYMMESEDTFDSKYLPTSIKCEDTNLKSNPYLGVTPYGQIEANELSN